ncbi:uncharacterized protein N7511_006091 [Penicillium nucicola]|uniref:uncharacterized protein n=1 Tax=Penicillium nucicola TaxID=1850975 RepID=UPI002544EC56|nr:uncharacterized protein N7511_006091 [Penicillium nucicola]KAJ5757397.1 hypothetical protein N7511_006091 [Penicillium nucicola]
MAPTLKTLVIALGFVFSAAVNASPSMLMDEVDTQPQSECITWYAPQLRTPPETCNDVVNMHPGLDLATLLKLNPSIHSYCDNMLLGQKVCIRAKQETDCPKATESSPKATESSPKATESSPKEEEADSGQWQTSASSKPQATSSAGATGWH